MDDAEKYQFGFSGMVWAATNARSLRTTPFGFCVPPPKCYRSRRPWSFGECRLISKAENVGLRIRMRER
jgi:hypothetical protein